MSDLAFAHQYQLNNLFDPLVDVAGREFWET